MTTNLENFTAQEQIDYAKSSYAGVPEENDPRDRTRSSAVSVEYAPVELSRKSCRCGCHKASKHILSLRMLA
jgi:hypothetical protein